MFYGLSAWNKDLIWFENRICRSYEKTSHLREVDYRDKFDNFYTSSVSDNFTTTIQVRLDCNSTALPPFYVTASLFRAPYTFTSKQAQKCVQAIKPLQYVIRRTPGMRIGTRPILHSHRLDTEPSRTTSWYHSWRTMLHGPGLCRQRNDLPVWWRSSSGLFQCPQQRSCSVWSKDVMDQKSAESGKWAPLQ